MLGIKQYMAQQNDKEATPTQKVLVASVSIRNGDQLSDKNTEYKVLEVGTFPKDAVTEADVKGVKDENGKLKKKGELADIETRSVKMPREPGDWICKSQLTAPGAFGASGQIPPGMRVITIPVDATTTHSGMMQPGNRIDLFLTMRHREENAKREKEVTIPLLEYIEVFAVDNQKYGVDTSTENSKARNISLLVDPDQAMRLTTAKKKGTISTLLRSTDDKDSINVSQFSEDDLHGTQREINDISTLDTLNEAVPDPIGFNLDADNDIRAQLQAELTENTPEPGRDNERTEDDEFWTMAIHEGGGVRVERVSMVSDEPIDTSGRNSPAGRTAAGFDPAAVGVPPIAVPEPNENKPNENKPGDEEAEEDRTPEEELLDKVTELLETDY